MHLGLRRPRRDVIHPMSVYTVPRALHGRNRRRNRRTIYRFLPCCLLVLAACGGWTGTEPTAEGSLRRSPVHPAAPVAYYESVGSVLLGGVGSNGFNTSKSASGPTLPNSRLLYRVTASGTVTAARSPFRNNGPTGPSCYAAVYVGSTPSYGGETWYAPPCTGSPPLSASGHVYMAGPTTVNRGPSSGASQWDCYTPSLGYGGCFLWTDDGQSIEIERVVATLSVSAAPSSVNFNELVNITAGISPGTLDGKDVPWTIDSTRWAPASGSQASPCWWSDCTPSNTPERTCRKKFTRSGAFTIFATVNGARQSQSVAIEFTPPRLTVTAMPSTLPSPGAVTFAATITPGASPQWFPAWTWSWRPDAGSGGICSNCNWNENPCTRTVSKSGWMRCSVTMEGYTLIDSARVYVTACPTGDSLMDSWEVRKAMADAMTASNANHPDELQRLEQGGYMVRDRVTGQRFVITLTAGASNCGIVQVLPPAIDLTKYRNEGSFHTHPYDAVLEPITRCRNPLTGVVEERAGAFSMPGASEDDQVALADLNAWLIANNQPPISEYVMNKQFITRLDPQLVGHDVLKWSDCPTFAY